MSVNSQILNIIHDIEELNEETTAINENIVTINGTLENLEDNKQNKIQVTDNIQISKLKTQYITMSLTGNDLQSTINLIDTDIGKKQDKLIAGTKITIDENNNISSTTEKGDQGIQGETGLQGIQGDQGIQGEDNFN